MASVTDGFSYDVFLSFRGEDTRYGFTGFLYKALLDRGIRTFMDDEELQKGDEITPSLVKAIQQSRIAIIVLSKNYASSSFCLKELSTILDHNIKEKGRLVWPVFYKVDPSDVRKLKGTYGEAMATHEARSNDNMDRLWKWKNALHQVANLSGFHYKKGDGYEHEFIRKIVEQVSREIKPVTLPVADYLVGLETQTQNVTSLLNFRSNDEVHMVGIHGIGGIGKTTLALAVYNSIAHQFEGSCFLENVRENSDKHGLPYLQKILLSQVVGEKNIELTGFKQGISILQQRLRQKKILLILDDIDKEEQLHAVAGKPDWFGLGSRVIFTTRDKRLLTCHGVESTYEVEELNKKDASELLKWKAFKTNEVIPSFADVLKRALTYASGLPLSLEVIGSHLFNKTIEQCKSALDRYERIPDKKVQTILQISFDALEEEEKSVFLDIACFFKGYKLAKVEKILHAHHGDNKKDHISVLVEKSLIRLSGSGNVTLHDLIEDMGKEIVRQESPEEPGKRSRLWFPKDIVHVLEENMGSSKIETICLHSRIEVKWDGEAFKKMKNLRTLIINDGQFSESPNYLPNSLRILEWELLYPSLGLPFDFYPKKLVICNFAFDFASFLWGDFFTKKFEIMRVLNLDCCRFLTQIPNVSGLPNLEEISFQHCGNLIAIDDSVGLLDKLKFLSVRGCRKLMNIPTLKLASLEVLDLSSCFSLERFPPVVDGLLIKLKILRVLSCINLSSIPPLKLDSLEVLDLSNCNRLESFPPIVDGLLEKLKFLSFQGCMNLKNIPPLKLASLEELHLSYCSSLESFPPVVDGLLEKLKILSVRCCQKIRDIPPLKLASLEQLDFSYCISLQSFPTLLDGSLEKLKILSFEHCHKLKSFPLLKLASLEQLDLSYCDSLESFPLVVDGLLDKLKIFSVKGCSKIRSIPSLNSALLEQLDLSYCISLDTFPEILSEVIKITQFRLDNTPIKELPPSFQNLTQLQTLYLKNCGIVQLPRSIVVMSELTELTIENGGLRFPEQDKVEEKVSPMQSSKVEFLHLLNCRLPYESLAIGLKWFANVKELWLSGSKFTILPECIEKCYFLWKLVLDNCEELEEIKGIPPSLNTLSALNCRSLISSCKSKLLNQELHEAGNTSFLLPGAEIPEWFDHQCMEGLSISFWFFNKFPTMALFFVSPAIWYFSQSYASVTINGNVFSYRDGEVKYEWLGMCHLHLFHMQMEKFNDNLDKAILENKWNHAEVKFSFPLQKSGIHVLNDKSSVKDIQSTNPENYEEICMKARTKHEISTCHNIFGLDLPNLCILANEKSNDCFSLCIFSWLFSSCIIAPLLDFKIYFSQFL